MEREVAIKSFLAFSIRIIPYPLRNPVLEYYTPWPVTRSAMHRNHAFAWFRAEVLGGSMSFVHKKHLAECYLWTITTNILNSPFSSFLNSLYQFFRKSSLQKKCTDLLEPVHISRKCYLYNFSQQSFVITLVCPTRISFRSGTGTSLQVWWKTKPSFSCTRFDFWFPSK